MMPKTEKELELYIKLLELIDAKKLVDAGMWAAGSSNGYEMRKEQYRQLKDEYLKLSNE